MPTLSALSLASALTVCEVTHTTHPLHIPQFVTPIRYTYNITTTKGHTMTLDEYKELVEAQRLASLAVALDALTKSNAIAKEMNK